MNHCFNWSVKLAESIMAEYPDPDAFPYRSWSYSQGFVLWGMIKLWEQTGNMKYYNYVFQFVDRRVHGTDVPCKIR